MAAATCSHCAAPVQPGWKACPTCGERLTAQPPTFGPLGCPACNFPIQAGQELCGRCRSPLQWDASAAPALAVAAVRPPVPLRTAAPAVTLACPNCGGMLPVPATDAEYVACRFCGSTLQLQRQGSQISFALVQQLGRAIGAEVGDQVSRRVGRQVAGVRRDVAAHQAAQTTRALEQELAQLRVQLPQLRAQAILLHRRGTRLEHEAARQAFHAAAAREAELAATLGQAPLTFASSGPPAWLVLLVLVFCLFLIAAFAH